MLGIYKYDEKKTQGRVGCCMKGEYNQRASCRNVMNKKFNL